MVARGGTPAVRVLRVLLGETEVGTLTHLPGENTLFVFDEAYVADAGRPILSLSFKTRDHTQVFRISCKSPNPVVQRYGMVLLIHVWYEMLSPFFCHP